jgi:hypothetical protein
LSRQTLDYTVSVIRRHRRQSGSPWRKLNPGRRALLVPACLHKGETFAELAAGFGIGTAAWRCVTETVALLAVRAAKLRQAPRRQEGRARLPDHRRHLNPCRPGRRGPALLLRQASQARDEPARHREPGGIVWVPGPLPGAVHDLTTARIWGIIPRAGRLGPGSAGR